jgi:CRISPR system Cascade subunit CasD
LEGAPYALQKGCDDLLKPKFHLYLGRKSCPLAATLKPLIRPANAFRQALDDYPCGPLFISDRLLRTSRNEAGSAELSRAPSLTRLSSDDVYALSLDKQQVRYYWEGDTQDFDPQLNPSLAPILTRHDQPLSRRRWQFTQRMEHLFMKEAE